MAKLLQWVKLPSEWILDHGLRQMRWDQTLGANNIAALMVLAPILHRADPQSGLARITYDELALATSLSRSKISEGLGVLDHMGLIEREPQGRSTIRIRNFDPKGGWAKFPAQRLYSDGQIVFFNELHLRKIVELDALKLWYFLAARRDNSDNLAKATYDQITEITGIARVRLKSAISLLAANMLVHVERIPTRTNDYGVAQAYRLPQIDSGRHMGTIGRGMTVYDDIEGL